MDAARAGRGSGRSPVMDEQEKMIEVMGLREAMDRGNDVYIVTSLFSISEISAFIKENYKGTGRCPVIYSV